VAKIINTSRLSLIDSIWILGAVILIVGNAYMATAANFDLAIGRFALHMDERITFDGVQRILHPENFKAFWSSVIDGNDHRYGRSLWNSIATASLLPTYFFGDTGQIISSRMLQVLLLTATFLVLAQTFVRNQILKTILLMALFAMPNTEYFMTIPKPEPLQIFFLAVFLFFYKKNDLAFGRHWIFLGLAFGTKISTLPLIIVFTGLSFFLCKHKLYEELQQKQFWTAFSYSLLGLGLAVPILLAPVLAGILAYLLFRWISAKLGLSNKITVLATGVTTVFLIIAARKKILLWIQSTFLNTKHGADQEAINFISWTEYFFDSWLIAPKWMGLVLFICAGAFLAYHLGRRLTKRAWYPFPVGLALVLSGLLLNLAIFASVQRLWGFYLYPGSVLILVGVFSLIDLNMDKTRNEKNLRIFELESFLARGTATVVAIIAIGYWVPHSVDIYKNLSIRTEQPKFKVEVDSYVQIVDILTNLSQAQQQKLIVAYDPILFPATSNSNYKLVEFWGPYKNWDSNADVIVFSAVHTSHGKPCLAGSLNYQACLTERTMYSKYVIDKETVCAQAKCYKRYAELPNKGEILLLELTNSVSNNN
jgi:hypothetical protein